MWRPPDPEARRPRRAPRIRLLLLPGLLAITAPAAAQQPPARPPVRPHAATDSLAPPGLAAAGDWTQSAVRRLVALGGLDVADATVVWPVSRAWLRRRFAAAAAGAASRSAAPAADYLFRYTGQSPVPGRRLGLTIAGGIAGDRTRSRRLAGRSVRSATGFDYTGPRERPDTALVSVPLSAWLGVGDFGTAGADVSFFADGVLVHGAALALAVGPAEVWGGRRSFQAGGHAGGIVLNGVVPFDGAGVSVPDGFRLPGFLAGLGVVRIDGLVSRLERSGDIERPWFFAQRISFAPSPASTIGLNRAAIFGGEGNEPVSAWRLFWLALGQTDVAGKDSDFENQVVSVDATFRLPGSSPVLVRAEYAFDDWGWAFLRVPAISAGVELAALPGAPDAWAGAELTWFAGRCCRYPEWYRHGALAEGWTDRGVLLGHALGGEGVEFALHAGASPARAAWILESRAFLRRRGDENLFSPERQGGSGGIEARLTAFPASRLRLEARASGEWGRRWRESTLRIAWIGVVR